MVDCSICLEAIADGSGGSGTTCDHNFHEICLIYWLHIKENCPICRSPIMINCINTPYMDHLIEVRDADNIGDFIKSFDLSIINFVVKRCFSVCSEKNKYLELRFLLKKYSSYNKPYHFNNFIVAIIKNNLKIVHEYMIYITKYDMLFDPTEGDFVILFCVNRKRTEILNYLLFGTVDMDFRNFYRRRFFPTVDGDRPLKYAIENNNTDMIKYMLSLSKCPFELHSGESWRCNLPGDYILRLIDDNQHKIIEIFVENGKFNIKNNLLYIFKAVDISNFDLSVMLIKHCNTHTRKKILKFLEKEENKKIESEILSRMLPV